MGAAVENSCGVAIVGASSLRGKELKQLLEERSFSGSDIRLLDEEAAVGTLTEAGGEPAVIGAVDEESFRRVRFAFFAGASEITARYRGAALRAGATVIDLSEPASLHPGAVLWIPALDDVLPPPEAPRGEFFRSPGTPTILACAVAAVLRTFSPHRLVMVFFQPVSERGQRGIDELEGQTINLLSFKPISQEVFGAQVAFNLLGSYGSSSEPSLATLRAGIAREVTRYLAGRLRSPAIQLVHAPVFYSYAFTAYAELKAARDPCELEEAAVRAGLRVQGADDAGPSNLSVAGEAQPVLARIERDPGSAAGYWLWGAGDNLRLAAANALAIAEKLLAS